MAPSSLLVIETNGYDKMHNIVCTYCKDYIKYCETCFLLYPNNTESLICAQCETGYFLSAINLI